MAYIVMAYTGLVLYSYGYIIMAYIGMAYTVMTYIGMARIYTVMAYILMAHIVMAYTPGTDCGECGVHLRVHHWNPTRLRASPLVSHGLYTAITM